MSENFENYFGKFGKIISRNSLEIIEKYFSNHFENYFEKFREVLRKIFLIKSFQNIRTTRNISGNFKKYSQNF